LSRRGGMAFDTQLLCQFDDTVSSTVNQNRIRL